MCNCKKGVPANQSPVTSGRFASNNQILRYGNDDFVVKYYIGETGNYVGSSTGIDYGIRTFNAKTMVHASDFEADSQFFSDTPQVSRGIQEPEAIVPEIVNDTSSEVVAEPTVTTEPQEATITKTRKQRIKKEKSNDEKLENTV